MAIGLIVQSCDFNLQFRGCMGSDEEGTCNRPSPEETLTILGETDSFRRGINASIILFAP